MVLIKFRNVVLEHPKEPDKEAKVAVFDVFQYF